MFGSYYLSVLSGVCNTRPISLFAAYTIDHYSTAELDAFSSYSAVFRHAKACLTNTVIVFADVLLMTTIFQTNFITFTVLDMMLRHDDQLQN